MTREMIATELNKRGYKAELQNSIKNGVVVEGIRLATDTNVSPIIYTDDLLKDNASVDEIVNKVIEIFERNKCLDFNPEVFLDLEFFIAHVYIAVQKTSNEDLVKRESELEGIECYLYVRSDKEGENYSVKVTEKILEHVGITENLAWKYALSNTEKDTKIESMAKVLAESIGMEYSEEMEGPTPFYVVSNNCKVKGASGILCKGKLAEYAERWNSKKIVVLPSSVNEMIIMPYADDIDMQMMNDMVRDVNMSEVAPVDRLTDRAYLMEF